jgi:hypothetical protein
MSLDLGIIWAIHSARLNLPPKIYFSSGYRFWTLQHLKSNTKMSNSTTIRRNDGSEHIYSGQNAPLRRNWFEFFQKFSFVHSFFTCLTVIKNLTFFLSNFPPSTLLYNHKNALTMKDLRCVEREKKKAHHHQFSLVLSPPPPSLWCLIPFPAFPSLSLSLLPFLALPCVALPCVALRCLALPYLALFCRALPSLA